MYILTNKLSSCQADCRKIYIVYRTSRLIKPKKVQTLFPKKRPPDRKTNRFPSTTDLAKWGGYPTATNMRYFHQKQATILHIFRLQKRLFFGITHDTCWRIVGKFHKVLIINKEQVREKSVGNLYHRYIYRQLQRYCGKVLSLKRSKITF